MISTGVRFVMIGGYAYNLYRNPRATGDIDFLVAADSDNESRLRSVLINFGFEGTLPESGKPLLEDGKVIMLGRAPFRIDLLTRIDGVDFDEVYTTRNEMTVDELLIPVISPKTLIKNKRAAGRPKDIPDILELQTWLESEPDN
ncbi:nucleotidyl transferase AbiEii/AbiGii toxin family protein [Fuerstiella marisgermanici]